MNPVKNEKVKGYLLHISHYDPVWVKDKSKEQPFDLDVAKGIIDTLSGQGFNLLVVDCEDGVVFLSHPELKKHYSVPMEILKELAAYARARGLELVPKLNFSQSDRYCHNHWFAPHNELFDSEEYLDKGFELIDELIKAMKPERFFHIGMDEDHNRSYSQYVDILARFLRRFKERGLRPVIWNDSACGWPCARIHLEKSIEAETKAPKEFVHVLWEYQTVSPDIAGRIKGNGLDVWVAPGLEENLVKQWGNEVKRLGLEGMLMTEWLPCIKANQSRFIENINKLGVYYREI